MKTKFTMILTLFMALIVQLSFAQQKTISGTVSDENGLPLLGATVVISGTTSGTTTDFDGKFMITASTGDVLNFSYVGYQSQNITVGTSNTVNVTLQLDNTLDEVVVTAQGIKSNPRSLSYSVQSVDSEDITKSRETNLVSAAQSALVELQEALNSTDEQADFIYRDPAQNANPLYLFDNDRPSTLGFSSSLYTLMTGDPRLPFYTTDGETFAGVEGLFWGQSNSPTPLISYWEVKFLEAEAIIRTSGTDANALVALQEAVRSNMLYIGVSTANIDTYVNALTLTGTMEQKIETIITEKYKSLYGNAPLESWTDFRRTGYPNLTANPDAVLSVNPSGIIPRRFLYPITERTTNGANYDAAISAQGGHLLDVDLWAFPIN